KLVVMLIAIFGLATMTLGQQPETALPRRLSVDVNVVLVNATVTDSQGRPVAKLEREHFRLWEDRIEQALPCAWPARLRERVRSPAIVTRSSTFSTTPIKQRA